MKTKANRICSMLAMLLALLLVSCGGNDGIEASFPTAASVAASSSEAEPSSMPPQVNGPSGSEAISPDPDIAASGPAAPEFVEAFLSLESVFYQTMVASLRENPETYMDSVYMNDVIRIRNTLGMAVALWEDDAFGQGDTRAKTYFGRGTIQDGQPVQIDHTMTARYEADNGRFTVDVAEDGKLINRTECIKTSFGYLARYHEAGNRYYDINPFQIMVSLRDADGMIGIDPNAPPPKELTGEEAFEQPQTLRDWFALEGGIIKVHSAQGANTEFTANSEQKE